MHAGVAETGRIRERAIARVSRQRTVHISGGIALVITTEVEDMNVVSSEPRL